MGSATEESGLSGRGPRCAQPLRPFVKWPPATPIVSLYGFPARLPQAGARNAVIAPLRFSKPRSATGNSYPGASAPRARNFTAQSQFLGRCFFQCPGGIRRAESDGHKRLAAQKSAFAAARPTAPWGHSMAAADACSRAARARPEHSALRAYSA